MNILIEAMIFIGSVLMILNILRYYRFTRKMEWMKTGALNFLVLFTPLVLLIFFLMGYLFVGIWGKPDLMVGGILFGGSVFVYIILQIMYFITDRVREDEHLRIALDEARKANEAKTIFLSNMSHDIRTPMNAVIGYTQLALQKDTSPETMRDYLTKIYSSGQHLLALINDVLEMSRIESGKLELEATRTSLCQVMREVRDMFVSQMESKHLHFSVSTDQMNHHTVYCDRNRLNRILLNLISNAYKFTPEGGSIDVSVVQSEVSDGRGIYEIRIRDTGIGMSKEFSEKIFEAFERERTSTVTGIQGTGLGMAITKNIVELMQGTIHIDTAPGEGTDILVRLPLRLAEEETDDAADHDHHPAENERSHCGCMDEPQESQPKAVDFSGYRILLVEDNEINREIAGLILQQTGVSYDTADNGKNAVDIVTASRPGYYDAILMDIQMPVMNGYEATRAIRDLPDPVLSAIPVIAMTANAFREDIQMEEAAGINAHISKPVDLENMLSVLAPFLQKKTS